MITIESPYIQAFTPTYSAAIAAEISLDNQNYASLTTIGFGDQTSLVISDPDGAETLPEDWSQVTSVLANGESLIPALDPADPQMGEFVFNPYTNTVQAYTTLPVRSLVVGGVVRGAEFFPSYLNQPYPALFTNLPLKGNIQIGLSFENQPSGSFEFETSLSKGQIQTLFAPGLELDLYGIGLRISSLTVKEVSRASYAGTRCNVSISFGGKLENYLSEPVFLRDDGKNPITHPQFECASNTPRNQKQSTTIQKLLGRVGIKYFGSKLENVPIPLDTPKDATVNLLQLLQERLRLANSFVRWSSARGVEVIPITNLTTWYYSESDLKDDVATSYDAIAKSNKRKFTLSNLNPADFNLDSFSNTVADTIYPTFTASPATALSFEYPNVELSGNFVDLTDDLEERQQGDSKPRFVRKEVKRETRIDGDANAHIYPEGINTISVMSLCFDIGGDTKDRVYVTEEDGLPISVISETWGFVYTADEIYVSAIADSETGDTVGGLRGLPDELWKCLKRTQTQYNYDKDTGYLLSTLTTGYNTVRFLKESPDAPETLELFPAAQEPDEESDPEYFLYKFRQIPVLNQTSYSLKLLPDESDQGIQWVTVCNRDGTSSLQAVVDPNYAPPYYAERERTESVAFGSTPNPENEIITQDGGIGAKAGIYTYLPDLITGEESRFESSVETTEAIYQRKLIGFEDGYPIYERGAEISPAKFVRYVKQYKAQGQQIAEAVEQTYIEEGTGQPPAVSKRPPQFTVEEPKPKDKLESEKPEYRYYLRTDGYDIQDPINGTESFPLARNFEEALKAAKCKAAIENWRNGLRETVTISGNLRIREGDRFNYVCNGESRQRVVISINHTFNILGVVDGEPRVTLVTTLTLGQWFLPNVEFSKVLIPNTEISGATINVVNDRLGGILPWSRVRSRRNPEAKETEE